MLETHHPKLPEDPRFYQHVLDHLPTPALVVNHDGLVVYGNRALVELSGWGFDEGIGLQMLHVIHPDDLTYVVESFSSLLGAEPNELDLHTASWAPVRFRVIGADGSVIPIEVTGAGGLLDSIVGGLVYSVRSCRDDDLLTEVFRGASSNQPIENAAGPLVQRLALPPLRMAAAVFEQHADGSNRCVASTHPIIARLPASVTEPVPWAGLVTEPTQTPFANLPVALSRRLRDAGFRSIFHAGAHAPDHASTLRVIGCCEDEHSSGQGPLAAIVQARELLSIVAQKAHNDRLITNNANRDELTGLPNRVGLGHRYTRAQAGAEGCALLFVDLDSFKSINDELGHLAGDRVLAAVADRLVRTVRPDDFVSRIGGDEFAVLLVDSHGRLSPEAVESVARRVVVALNEPLTVDGIDVALSASVGVARALDDDLDELMALADDAMYRAKRAGGGRLHLDGRSMMSVVD